MTRLLLAAVLVTVGCHRPAEVCVGSKLDGESVVLAELARRAAETAGVSVEARHRLGGTPVVWAALVSGQIDAYPEYTGTLTGQILAGRDVSDDAKLRQALAEHGIAATRSLGFANNYAVGMKEARAAELNVKSISDLKRHAKLKFGFSPEFLGRADGWQPLKRKYELPQTAVRNLDHQLCYEALNRGDIDATDLYTTDPEIRRQNLRVLTDDLHYFPAYESVILYRADLAPHIVKALSQLEGKIDAESMIELNAKIKEGVPDDRVAVDFLKQRLGLDIVGEPPPTFWRRLGQRGAEHLFLVGVSLTLAVLVAVPLGVAAAKLPKLGQAIVGVTGLIQTIPSLALLVFMIPLPVIGGLGWKPAVTALFLYSLLPIVRNTATGLREISPSLRESAESLGLSARARLRLVEMPLASRSILAGVKTAAVINVGTATLGALIGAGGFGEPIQQGLYLKNTGLILEGAVPSALLAVMVQGLFELGERFVVPRGLRL